MQEKFNQAQFIADRFGGRRSFAAATGFNIKTVDYWCRTVKHIPEDYRPDVLRAAAERGIDVTAFDFIRHLVTLAA
jgi:hypothetical protein